MTVGPRYVVLGAGAVGGVIGGRLHQAGCDVTLVTRGAHLDAVRRNGLTLHDPGGSVVVRVPSAATPAAAVLEPGDVVVLAVKTQDTAAALDSLVALSVPGLRVVCAQNGVENERMALRRFADVYGMCVMLPATLEAPGVVLAHGAPRNGILDVGRYPAGVDQVATTLAADLERAGFSSRPDPAVMRWKHTKLLLNLGNALEAACGSVTGIGSLWREAKVEAEACFAAAAIDHASEEEDRSRREGLLRIEPIDGFERGGGSSWQSLARGAGTIETDFLNGEIVLLGRLHGVPTPVNRVLQEVANELARSKAPPGSMPVEALEARVAAARSG